MIIRRKAQNGTTVLYVRVLGNDTGIFDDTNKLCESFFANRYAVFFGKLHCRRAAVHIRQRQKNTRYSNNEDKNI